MHNEDVLTRWVEGMCVQPECTHAQPSAYMSHVTWSADPLSHGFYSPSHAFLMIFKNSIRFSTLIGVDSHSL